MSRLIKIVFNFFLVCIAAVSFAEAQTKIIDFDSIPQKRLRLAAHIFQKSDVPENFSADSADMAFISALFDAVNHRYSHLLPLDPAFESPYIQDARLSFVLDSVYFHIDSLAWDAGTGISSEYIYQKYIVGDENMSYQQKYQTLHLFITGNADLVGGHADGVGNKSFVATRGYYNSWLSNGFQYALNECSRNLCHEFGHAMGLLHNFQGGPLGEQCDDCDDNGCPEQGTSNNIMDLWPSYGYALSQCQIHKVHDYLAGNRGSISDVVIHEICDSIEPADIVISEDSLAIMDEDTYLNGDIILMPGASLIISSNVYFVNKGRIKIYSGAKLNINHCEITSLCGDFWDGMIWIPEEEHSVPTSIQIKNATLSNAFCAILLQGERSVDNRNKLFLHIDSVSFLNCRKSIEIENLSFDHADDFSVGINQADFTYDENYPQIEYVEDIGAAVRLKNVSDLSIFNSSFWNQLPDDLTRGNFPSGIEFINCPGLQIKYNRFQNLERACLGLSSLSHASALFEGNTFINNIVGIRTDALNWIEIINNEFEIRRHENYYSGAIHVSNAFSYRISGNKISSLFGGEKTLGILLESMNSLPKLIDGNSIEGTLFGFVLVPGINWDLGIHESVECQDFSLKGPQFRQNKLNTDFDFIVKHKGTRAIAYSRQVQKPILEVSEVAADTSLGLPPWDFNNGFVHFEMDEQEEHVPFRASDFIYDNLLYPETIVPKLPDYYLLRQEVLQRIDSLQLENHKLSHSYFPIPDLNDDHAFYEYFSGEKKPYFHPDDFYSFAPQRIPPAAVQMILNENPQLLRVPELFQFAHENNFDLQAYYKSLVANLNVRTDLDRINHEITDISLAYYEELRRKIRDSLRMPLWINQSENAYNDYPTCVSNYFSIADYSDKNGMPDSMVYEGLVIDEADRKIIDTLLSLRKNNLPGSLNSLDGFDERSLYFPSLRNLWFYELEMDYPFFTMNVREKYMLRIPESKQSSLKLYPNPARSYIFIDYLDQHSLNKKLYLEIVNLSGQIVSEQILDHPNFQKIDCLKFPAGMYFVRVMNHNKELKACQKFIILKK